MPCNERSEFQLEWLEFWVEEIFTICLMGYVFYHLSPFPAFIYFISKTDTTALEFFTLKLNKICLCLNCNGG